MTLSPTAGGSAEPVSQTVPLAPGADGSVKASITFSDVVIGVYTVEAKAMDASGTVLFSQVSKLDMNASSEPVTLNLAPADIDSIAMATSSSISATLPAKAAKTWRLPAGSSLLAARSLFLRGLGPDCHLFIQDSSGVTIVAETDASRLDTGAIPRDAELLLTLYNGSGTAVDVSAFVGPIMVPVPSGTFQRDLVTGNNSYVSAFSMGTYEVTRAQFLAVMGSDPSVTANSSGTDDPVQNVNWYHAIAFCNKLSLMEGLTPVYSVSVSGTPVDWSSLLFAAIPVTADDDWKAATINNAANGYRLPTDMEWMWAAMGATSDRSNGNAGTGINLTGYNKGYAGSTETGAAQVNLGDYASTVANSPNMTHPAGTKLPNELALFDMSGNVSEWCQNWYATLPPYDLINYQGPASGVARGVKGGSCANLPSMCQSFQPGGDNPATVQHYYGFRVARNGQALYSVTYDGNGATNGAVPVDLNVYQTGDAAQVLANTGTLLRTGSAFAGWNTRADGTGVDCMPYGGSIAVGSEPVTLYARWLSDYASPNIGALKAIPVGSYQRDATATTLPESGNPT